MIKVIRKNDYNNEKNNIITLIDELFKNDNDEIASLDETITHLNFIFENDSNDAFLLLNIENNRLICMVNFLEYNNKKKNWCLFSLFTKKEFRNKGLAKEILLYGIEEVKKVYGNSIISGIRNENISSQNLHLLAGFIDEGKSWEDYAEGFSENHKGYIYYIKK